MITMREINALYVYCILYICLHEYTLKIIIFVKLKIFDLENLKQEF